MIIPTNNYPAKQSGFKKFHTNNFNPYYSNAEQESERLNSSPFHLPSTVSLFNNLILAAISNIQGAEKLVSHLESVSLSAGKNLYSVCRDCEYVYFPETCVISHLHSLADGNMLETAMIGREGMSGLHAVFGSQSMNQQAIVTLGGTARRIRTAILRQEFLYINELQTLMHDYLNTQIHQISQKVVCESFHLMESRLCSWLLTLCERAGKDHFRLTQEQISLLLGSARPGVTVVLKKLRDEGIVNYLRGNFSILDVSKLKTKACECYLI